ncbi:MAG: DUF2813 domain-containing protein, partial [Proteobacteria bacterium]|nr:DUF2813 domain-containing protein [Pseudomonadota bacterium]
MLSKLEITKFRGFKKHSIKFRNMALAVGKNNAVKSTIVEALRLVALVTQRASNLTFREPPNWIKQPAGSAGVSPSLANIDFEFTYIIHGYGEPPAVIKAIFADGKEIIIYLNDKAEELFVVLRDRAKKPIISRAQLIRDPFHKISILPPVFPVQKHELVLQESRVRAKVMTNLASSHFRNQLRYFDGPIDALRELLEETWKGIQLTTIDTNRLKRGKLEIKVWIRPHS